MALFRKFYQFAGDIGLAVHDLNADTLKVYLTNNTPSLSDDAVKADLAGITEEHGYAAADVTNTYSQTSGLGSLAGTDVVWTASGGTFGPFRYVVLYNDGTVVKTDPLIGYWDYGVEVTVPTGETFTVDFGTSIFTIT
jgi:hypothetical protein